MAVSGTSRAGAVDAAVPRSAGAWAEADRAVRGLDVGPAVVELLVELSLAEGESAWSRPALSSFYRDEGDTATAELFFAEMKELTLAAQSVAVERRYAPWAQTTALSELPASTLEAAEPPASPSVWLARWTGVVQRLAPTWEKVHPFLLDLADETPILPEEDRPAAPSEGLGGLSAFIGLLEALVEPAPAKLAIAASPPTPFGERQAEFLRRHVASVPRGPVEWALRGRTLEFLDGVRLEFLRYPRLAALTADPGLHATFALDDGPEKLPRSAAAWLGAYLEAAEPTLDAVATEFAARCGRAWVRLRERFAAELVQRSLVSGGPARGG